MSEIMILTPRGVELSATFINPVDTGDAAVLFSHSVLADRRSIGHFRKLAAAYRAAGYATLEFDYSGHGLSSDDVIVLASQVEDIKAASGWLTDQGFTRQVIHAHSFGAHASLAAHLPAARTHILCGVALQPVSFDWETIFSEQQLDDLETRSSTEIPDDSPGPRSHFTISKQTLADLSLTDASELLGNLEHPVLVIHDADDEEMGLVEVTQEVFPLLPAGSRVEVVRDESLSANETPTTLIETAVSWAKLQVPVVR